MERKKMYTILRVKKLKGFGSVKAYQLHSTREKETKNADENKTHLNFALKGNYSDLNKELKDFMTKKDLKIRGEGTKNESVLATEMMLTASPEFFYECEKNIDGSIKYKEIKINNKKILVPDFKKDKEGNRILKEEKTYNWIKENDKWLKEKYGENLICSIVHLDETSPHISALVCATKYNNKTKKEELAHKAWFGKQEGTKKIKGYNKLRDLQTEYTEEMQNRGFTELQRGEIKSKAKHSAIQSFYTDIELTKMELNQELENKEKTIKEVLNDLESVKVRGAIEIQTRNQVVNRLAENYKVDSKELNKMFNEEQTKTIKKYNSKSNNKIENNEGLEL